MNKIKLPTISEILKYEFMEPYGLTAYKLAKEINVPTSRIQDILHNRRKLTTDTALRLSKYFNLSDSYFLNIQNEIDIRTIKNQIQNELNNIKQFNHIA